MSADEKQETIARLFAGRFEIRESLAWNGLALVYAAKGLMHRDLAIAVLPLDAESSPEQSRLFHRTFERLKAQTQLPTPTIHDHGIQRGVPFVAWEREEGVLMADMLDGAMPVEGAVQMIDQILGALEAVHAIELHHGDLTPNNVLLQPDGIRLLGLGIAPLLRRVGPDATGPTGRGSGRGARAYLAPEVLQNRLTGPNAPGPASDVYSVGALLHRLLTGVAPGGDLDDAALDALEENPELATVIQRAMAEEGRDRPSASALRAMLAERSEAKPSTLPPADLEESAPPPKSEAAPKKPESEPPPAKAPPSQPATAVPESSGGAGKWIAAVVVVLGIGAGAYFAFGTGGSAESDVGDSESDVADSEVDDSEPDIGDSEADVGDSESDVGDSEVGNSDVGDSDVGDSESESGVGDSESGETEAEGVEADPLDSLGASGPLRGVSDPELVEELARIAERGDEYEQEDFRRIYGWIARNTGDVRGHLVLARAYAARGWHRAVVESYGEALGVDAEGAKSDPLILGQLIDAYVNGSEPVMAMAWPLLRRHWGPDAAAGLDAYETQALRPALRRRLRSLRSRVERLD